MSLAVPKILLSPTRHPAQTEIEERVQDRRLDISVIYTSPEATVTALQEARVLANRLAARLTLVVLQAVPYALSLENPPVRPEFNENRFREIATQTPMETSVQIYLCRDKAQTLMSVLRPASIVVMGGRRRWWRPTRDEVLARQLQRAGHEVIFKETEGG